MNFKNYLLNEQREYLAHKVGDILTSVQELVEAGKQIGARQLVRNSESVVNQIRKVLHSSWPRSEYKYLKKLQKCGVAIMKAIDEKDDLQEILNSVRAELEKVSAKIGEPINHLGTPSKDEGPPQQKKPQMPAAQPQMGGEGQPGQTGNPEQAEIATQA